MEGRSALRRAPRAARGSSWPAKLCVWFVRCEPRSWWARFEWARPPGSDALAWPLGLVPGPSPWAGDRRMAGFCCGAANTSAGCRRRYLEKLAMAAVGFTTPNGPAMLGPCWAGLGGGRRSAAGPSSGARDTEDTWRAESSRGKAQWEPLAGASGGLPVGPAEARVGGGVDAAVVGTRPEGALPAPATWLRACEPSLVGPSAGGIRRAGMPICLDRTLRGRSRAGSHSGRSYPVPVILCALLPATQVPTSSGCQGMCAGAPNERQVAASPVVGSAECTAQLPHPVPRAQAGNGGASSLAGRRVRVLARSSELSQEGAIVDEENSREGNPPRPRFEVEAALNLAIRFCRERDPIRWTRPSL